MAWRAFVDEMTEFGLHIIFTNDDSLTEETIRDVWDAPAKQKVDPKLRRFGKVVVLNTQAEVEAFCAAEIARLEAGPSNDVVPGAFVAPVVVSAPDPAVEAKYALQRAIGEYNLALQVKSVDVAYDITKAKQAVMDAQAALEALK